MATRKIKPNYRSVTGTLISQKQKSAIDFESTLERDFFTILEFDSSIESYIEQPVSIEYICELGIQRIYTPDVLVTFKDSTRQPWLCEIKYRADLRENFSSYKTKFKAAKKYAEEKGYKFLLIDESIRGDYLYNAKFLLKYRNREYDPEIKNDVVTILRELSNEKNFFTPAEFRDNFGQTFDVKITGLAEYWRLVMRREILFNHDVKVSMNTEMWLNDNLYGND